MSNEIKQEPSSSVTNESPETVTVPKAEFNLLKRKLKEVEPELAEYKRKFEEANEELVLDKEMVKLLRSLLEENEAELEKKRKKLKQFDKLKALVATDVKFKPKRARISLILPNFSKLSTQKEFQNGIFSEPVEVAGFQWKLCAGRSKKEENAGWMGLILFAYPPENYKGQFEIEIDFFFRLFNTFFPNDIQKEWKDRKIVPNARGYGTTGITKFAEIKDLLGSDNGFLQNDGSISWKSTLL